MANDWIDVQIGQELERQNRADKMKLGVARLVDRLRRSFGLCGFYDAEQLPHGGPRGEAKRT